MLIKASDSCLFVVDVQSRLLPAMYDPGGLTHHCRVLLQAARRLAIPILVSEHYPKGIGTTDAAVAEHIPAGSVAEKIHFSAYAEPDIRVRIDQVDRRQYVLCGIEAHVCVLQTALDLAEAGYETFVVADATCSRGKSDHDAALRRLRDFGVTVVTTEMVVFEWLHRAGTPVFKELSQLIK
jgi:nicotinamidase-related amidase